MDPEISVCIATWCRKDNLTKIIELLQNQTIPQEKYEIIVCDSYSNDGTDKVLEKYMEECSNIKYINTHKNVLAVKRNIGINAAKSPLVIFMDDDVLPTHGFIEAHLNAHKNSNNTVYCGQVRFPEQWKNTSNYYRYRDECHLGPLDINDFNDLPFNKIVVMNMSFKKDELMSKVGNVCEDFIGYGCEDLEFGYRILKSGIKMVYLEEALAYHYENSPSIESFGEKIFRASRDGAKILNTINPEILKNTNLVYLEDSNLVKKDMNFRIKRFIYRVLINKFIAKLLGKFLIKSDKFSFFYLPIFYRYYLAYKHKEGIKAREKITLSISDVQHGWYNK
jgi:glycosyltransferase involved in cell wall biosynthesis